MLNLLNPFVSLVRQRALLAQFIRREILGRYRGSALGLGWSLLTPLLMLSAYTFVFMGIFKARWPGAEAAGGVAFSLRLFAGMIIFQFVAEVLSRAPTLITSQTNLVKKVVFPLEILPAVAIGAALFHLLISAGLLLVAVLLFEPNIPISLWFAPLSIVPLLPLLLGLGWLLAALGVFLRDIATLMGFVTTLLMFLSPVFYALESLAPRWQAWMLWNPLTPAIETLRRALFYGLPPDWAVWWLALAGGLLVALGGAWVFNRMRRGFADVL